MTDIPQPVADGYLSLTDYPGAINDAKLQQDAAQVEIAAINASLDQETARLKSDVYSDTEYTNDTLRRSAFEKLKPKDIEISALLLKLESATDRQADARNHSSLLQNQYLVARLIYERGTSMARFDRSIHADAALVS